jgi:hypothetical protein
MTEGARSDGELICEVANDGKADKCTANAGRMIIMAGLYRLGTGLEWMIRSRREHRVISL